MTSDSSIGCPACGQPNRETARYCRTCGAALPGSEQRARSIPSAVPAQHAQPRPGESEQPAEPAGSAALAGHLITAGLPEHISHASRPRRSAPTRVVLSALAVVLVAAGAAGALAVTGSLGSATSSSPNRPAASPSPARSTPRYPGALTAIPSQMDGTWSGIGYQPTDSDTPTFKIIMTLQGGGTTGTTLYPSLGCQGQLTLLPGSSANAVRLSEDIITGPCTASGVFVVGLSGSSLDFNYQPDITSAPASYGTLHQ